MFNGNNGALLRIYWQRINHQISLLFKFFSFLSGLKVMLIVWMTEIFTRKRLAQTFVDRSVFERGSESKTDRERERDKVGEEDTENYVCCVINNMIKNVGFFLRLPYFYFVRYFTHKHFTTSHDLENIILNWKGCCNKLFNPPHVVKLHDIAKYSKNTATHAKIDANAKYRNIHYKIMLKLKIDYTNCVSYI